MSRCPEGALGWARGLSEALPPAGGAERAWSHPPGVPGGPESHWGRCGGRHPEPQGKVRPFSGSRPAPPAGPLAAGCPSSRPRRWTSSSTSAAGPEQTAGASWSATSGTSQLPAATSWPGLELCSFGHGHQRARRPGHVGPSRTGIRSPQGIFPMGRACRRRVQEEPSTGHWERPLTLPPGLRGRRLPWLGHSRRRSSLHRPAQEADWQEQSC